jgi:putative membrane protein
VPNPANLERTSTILTKVFLGLVVFGLLGTALSKVFKLEPGPIAPAVNVLLILCGALVVAKCIRDFLSIGILLIFCGGSEVIGVLTGFPFGQYEYTDRWWPTVLLDGHHRFPLLIPFAWLLVLGGCYCVLRTKFAKWTTVPLCALLTTIIDMPMERAMTEVFGYWKWTPPGPIFGAPIANSVGWFVVSLIAASILASRDRGFQNSEAWKVLCAFCVFVALCGGLAGFHFAWIILLAIGLGCVLIAQRVRPT